MFMPVYVDSLFNAVSENAQAKQHGTQWCHLICDGDLEELHRFAQHIGLKREWFQRSRVPHYDLTPRKRAQAIAAGAHTPTSRSLSSIRRDWINRWHGGDPDWEANRAGETTKK